MHFKTDKEAAWDKLEGAISVRRWDATLTAWIAFGIPLIDPPGSAPEVTLSGFLQDMDIPELGAPKNFAVLVSRDGVPELIFREAIFWLHKSIHVLGASEIHVDVGRPTWSLSSAYQSGFFSVRSILAFFGIAVGEVQGNSVVVDICRNLQGLSPRKVEELGAFEEEISLRSLGFLFGHVHIWMLFQRLLRVATRSPWPVGWTTFFNQLDVSRLTTQRHSLHYDLGFWVLDDLHHNIHLEAFRDVRPTGDARKLFDLESNNFSLSVAFTLSRMALSLFQSLAAATNRLTSEQALIHSARTPDRHPLFADSLFSPLVVS